MANIKTSISIDADLFKELTEMSIEQDRSFSKQIAYLAKKGKEAEYKEDLEKIRVELKGAEV